MKGGSPSRHQEKRSNRNQDHVAAPWATGHTKVACPRASAGGSRATCHRGGGQGSSAASSSHQAPAYVGADLIVDEEEEALERAGRTIAIQVQQSPYHGPKFVSDLVPFDGPLPRVREP
jgi:hypothetical protein